MLRETDGTWDKGYTHTRGLRFVQPSGHVGACTAGRPSIFSSLGPLPISLLPLAAMRVVVGVEGVVDKIEFAGDGVGDSAPSLPASVRRSLPKARRSTASRSRQAVPAQRTPSYCALRRVRLARARAARRGARQTGF